jgi:LPXTG-site transpeptidase (sortase) family protein
MASGKNALEKRKRSGTTGLPAVQSEGRKRAASKARKELRAIRILGLTAILLGLVALTLIGIKLYEGESAGKNATVLLEAYKTKATVSPQSSATPDAEDSALDTPEPTDVNYEQTDVNADAAAASDANEHLANDGSNEGVDESGEYVRPDAPEVSELDETIEKIIDATSEDGVIGILEIPELEEELPIIGKWSYKLLKISICRYKGPDPNEEGNLVIIGHNYKSGSHFGRLSQLSVGSEVYLTDSATGTRVRYEVYEIKSIAPDAFSALKTYRGDCGLTLMTCKDNGTNRLLVRCEQKETS